MAWINNYRNPFLDQYFVIITWMGSLFILLPLVITLLGYLLYRDKKEDVWLLGLGFGGAVLITYIIKIAISRPRPDHLPALVQMPADFSFPSGHTAQVTAFCLSVFFVVCRNYSIAFCWQTGIIGLFLICSVGYSRIYLQVHYVSDVVAGFLFSVMWVVLVKFLLSRVYP